MTPAPQVVASILPTLSFAVNPSSVMSPAGSSQAEEQQYLDKLKQLSKYIEPLRRMINKIDKNEGRLAQARTGPGHAGPVS